MNEIIEVIVEYKELILVAFSILFELIVFIVLQHKKSGDPIEQVILSLPEWISKAEKRFGAGHGQDKKEFVIGAALHVYKKLTGVKVQRQSYIAERFSKAIEDILETPERKGS